MLRFLNRRRCWEDSRVAERPMPSQLPTSNIIVSAVVVSGVAAVYPPPLPPPLDVNISSPPVIVGLMTAAAAAAALQKLGLIRPLLFTRCSAERSHIPGVVDGTKRQRGTALGLFSLLVRWATLPRGATWWPAGWCHTLISMRRHVEVLRRNFQAFS
ncbi:hypothetical protein BKA67DRAFT_676485 [Truncatella angustata]|uniref:Uncharacterized protein n=1 Tax=Truncatella angustata TaxID=152316 RepID=A0A9P8UL36_9PEZI|nr:uncharacterized protein BKA67DRAFT_676485 [Truncatella angustata]KAH6653970.1 hypothetical protein BKA67DRAFT_676485 [Truncatella angustata]